MRILEELYNTNIHRNKNLFTFGPDYYKAIKIISETEERLNLLLEGESKELFIENINAQMEINTASNAENFIIGFKLGMKMCIESINDDNQYFSDLL